MKCQHYKNLILLDDSGELSRMRRQFLERHLAHCPDCRAFRQDMGTLHQLSRATPSISPENQTIAAVHAMIHDNATIGTAVKLPHTSLDFRPALLKVAALFILLAGTAWLLIRTLQPDRPSKTLAALSPDNGMEVADDNSIAGLEMMFTENVVEIRRIEDLSSQQFTPLEVELMLLEGLLI